jgi:hypothetical protein
MKAKTPPPGFRRVRRDKLIQEHVHDSYRSRGKPRESTACPQCGALFHDGRWQWLPQPAQVHSETCPACHRIHDQYPAGYVTITGDFPRTHRDEVLHLVRNVETRKRAEHPLQRLMGVLDQDGIVTVTTTDVHLARGIGEALHHAYRGKLQFHYNPEQNLLRVHWER